MNIFKAMTASAALAASISPEEIRLTVLLFCFKNINGSKKDKAYAMATGTRSIMKDYS
jgi:hypothetical protein